MSLQPAAGTCSPRAEVEQALHAHVLEALEASLTPRERRKRGDGSVAEIAADAVVLLRERRAGEIEVRVHNPAGARRGRTALEVTLADQPFLVDTFRLAVRRLGLREMLLLHPMLRVERDAEGSAVRVGEDASGASYEAYLYAEVPLVKDARERERIEQELREVYAETCAAVHDYPHLVRAIREHAAEIEFYASLNTEQRERALRVMDLLSWLVEDHFVFLGYRRYRAQRTSSGNGSDDSWTYQVDAESGLGILRDADSRFLERVCGEQVPLDIRLHLRDERLVFFDKSKVDSRIHRQGRMDCITVKLLDAQGQPAGFGKFLGLLTHKAIRARGSDIPVIAHRRQHVLDAIGAQHGSHTYKGAIEAFDSLPVEFLFSFEVEEIARAVQRILAAMERQHVEVYVAADPLQRAYFASVILPRAAYDETLRDDVRVLLTTRYGATYIDHRSSFMDDDVALIHFFCSSSQDVDAGALGDLEDAIALRVARWRDRFEAALLERHRPDRAYAWADEYGDALPEAYRVVTEPADAVLDLESLERLRGGAGGVEIRLTRDAETEADSAPTPTRRLKLFYASRPYLTDLLPVLDHFGLRAVDAMLTDIRCRQREPLWVVAFRVEEPSAPASVGELEPRLLAGLEAVLRGHVLDDSLNRLILAAGLDWREVDCLRAYLAYARQLRVAHELPFASQVLAHNPQTTRALVDLLRARFDPLLEGERAALQAEKLAELKRSRERVATSAEDAVFGLLQGLVLATLRASFGLVDEGVHELAFKLDPRKVEGAPRPLPFAEIFVHSAEMCGVHLRGGPVARGGLRWSDRPNDFRAEVLGLMKTQMVKNGLIVPVGAKGGFVTRRSAPDRDTQRREADRLYARFVRMLLRLTDDLDGERVVPPERVVRYDGDDPYLVVAPDKGTAHLSDVANQVAREQGFWLDDAFASGGSRGYDHKALAITARGAWLCVERHFLELGLHPETEPFTFAGVGDMSGDVFGNGALLARRGRLVAAFDHRHVFLDPDPDPEVAWVERKRLFELPGSTWRDYDPSCLSPGGGVYERSARSIPLSEPVRARLGIEATSLCGEELIRAILRMPVDLLWLGGIGTYVKASRESHADVGDRANDAVRVDAGELRARVVGEGANLGFTQLARVEYALAGGRIDTDATQNCGGVNLSDREVNYKILLGAGERDGTLSREARDELLRGCAGEACHEVLRDSALQSRCLSMEQLRGVRAPDRFVNAAVFLSCHAGLDWKLEFLPERDELRERSLMTNGVAGYTRPELAVLLGYMKMLVKRSLLESELPDHPVLRPLCTAYFPNALRERFALEIRAHRLRREITASRLANFVIDQAGLTLVPELCASSGVDVSQSVAAYALADRLLGAAALREQLDAADIPENVRLCAALELEQAVRAGAREWLALRRGVLPDPDGLARWIETLAQLRAPSFEVHLLSAERRTREAELVEVGIPPELARELVLLSAIAAAFGGIALVLDGEGELDDVLELYARVSEVTRLGWLVTRLESIPHRDGWDRAAAESLHLEMLEVHRALAHRALREGNTSDPLPAACTPLVLRIEETAHQIELDDRGDLAPLAVLSQQIRRLC